MCDHDKECKKTEDGCHRYLVSLEISDKNTKNRILKILSSDKYILFWKNFCNYDTQGNKYLLCLCLSYEPRKIFEDLIYCLTNQNAIFDTSQDQITITAIKESIYTSPKYNKDDVESLIADVKDSIEKNQKLQETIKNINQSTPIYGYRDAKSVIESRIFLYYKNGIIYFSSNNKETSPLGRPVGDMEKLDNGLGLTFPEMLLFLKRAEKKSFIIENPERYPRIMDFFIDDLAKKLLCEIECIINEL